jgi:flagellar protein FliJ
MAKKETKGGKFAYGLETILKVRSIKEKREQEKFAEKQRDYLKEKEKEETIENQRKKKNREFKAILSRGPISDFERVLRRRVHLTRLKEELDDQVTKVLDASTALEEQRGQLVSAMKEREVIEKHKEHKLDEWKNEIKDLEIKFLDEIATTRFRRKQS